jgi:hypothetical protein
MFEHGRDTYLTPECQDLDTYKKSKIGRSSDIWSFGCILAEIMVYMSFGPQGVEQFSESRVFTRRRVRYGCFHCGHELNRSVEEWLSKLVNSGWSTSGLVALVKRMLSINEADRPRARDVTASLRSTVISKVSESIDGLFNDLHGEGESLDLFLERRRFDAWKYGLGIADEHGDFKLDGATNFGDKTFKLDSTLQYLNEMRSLLRSALNLNREDATGLSRDLADLNDRLTNDLSEKQQDCAKTYFSSVLLEGHFLTSIRHNQDNLSIVALDAEFRRQIALKTMKALTAEHANRDDGCRQIRPEQIKILEPFGCHHLGTFLQGEQNILIEWRLYGRQEVGRVVLEELFTRLESLTYLLKMEKPENFCSLPCRGFFHDHDQCRFGVVYDLPSKLPVNPWSGLVTLKSLITETFKGNRNQPLLEDKFKLASTLADAILQFHMVDWLHKDFTSSNVIFFCNQHAELQSKMIRKPYIIGFNYSRPDEISYTEGLSGSRQDYYQHPKYQQDKRGYRREYDYYSLGIMLLEIGLWTPIKEWKSKWTKDWKENKGRAISTEDVREKLLADRVPWLGPSMGSSYRDVVELCLKSNFLVNSIEDDDGRKKMLHFRFQKLVVGPLRERLVT